MHDPDEPDLDAVRRRLTRTGPHRVAGVPADARYGRVLGVRDPHAWAVRSSRSTGRRFDIDRAARHHRARSRRQHRHRGRRVRQTLPRALDDQPGPVGHLQPRARALVGRHVERGDEAGTAPTPPGDDARRRVLVVRGPRHRPVGLRGNERGTRRPSSCWARTPACSPTRAATSSQVRARRGWSRVAGSGRSATTRTPRSRPARSVSSTASGTRSPVTSRPWRPTARSGPRPRLGVHQHRRREGVPRGGRRGAQGAPGGA